MQPEPLRYAFFISRFSVSEPRMRKNGNECTPLSIDRIDRWHAQLTDILFLEIVNVGGCDWFEKLSPLFQPGDAAVAVIVDDALFVVQSLFILIR